MVDKFQKHVSCFYAQGENVVKIARIPLKMVGIRLQLLMVFKIDTIYLPRCLSAIVGLQIQIS